METVLARDHLRAPRGRAAELQRRLDSLGARAREQHPSERGRGALQERRGKQTGQRRDAELHFPGRLELERLDQGCADSRIVAPDVVHPEASEEIEISRSVRVVEVRPLGPSPPPVKADRPQQPDELGIDRPRVELELRARLLVEQVAEDHAVVVLCLLTIRTETIALRRIQ